MSKKKPEVGDVWGNGYLRCLVIFSDKVITEFLEIWNGKPNKRIAICREFIQAYHYLGKSKVSIKELFDVE